MIEHTEAGQAAEFATAQCAEIAVWRGFQWWHQSDGVSFKNVTALPNGVNDIQEVGGLFGTHLARRAVA